MRIIYIEAFCVFILLLFIYISVFRLIRKEYCYQARLHRRKILRFQRKKTAINILLATSLHIILFHFAIPIFCETEVPFTPVFNSIWFDTRVRNSVPIWESVYVPNSGYLNEKTRLDWIIDRCNRDGSIDASVIDYDLYTYIIVWGYSLEKITYSPLDYDLLRNGEKYYVGKVWLNSKCPEDAVFVYACPKILIKPDDVSDYRVIIH